MMGRILHSLNRLGMERFREYLSQLRDGATAPPPLELLDDSAFVTELPAEIVIELCDFVDRYSLGKYLVEQLGVLGSEITDRDAGLWSWLSLMFFEQVCPASSEARREPGRDYRHIPDFSYRHRHRHLLFGAYQTVRRHGVKALLLLSGPPDSETGLYHEIASRQDMIANKGVIEAAMLLYLDQKRGRPKRGAQGSNRQPGTVRRFVRVLQQLDVTYDIFGLSGMQIIELLPAEFDPWRPQLGSRFERRVEHDGAQPPRRQLILT